MTAHALMTFALATAVLMLIPGPNVALIVANSLAYGRWHGLLTVAGTSMAMVVQLAIAAVGMSAALGAAGRAVSVLHWLGVAYLLVLGIRQWLAPPADLTRIEARPLGVGASWARGFAVSLVNPKTLLFYAAFLPQFVAPGRPVGPQLAVLGAIFVGIAVVLDSIWALAAASARPMLAARARLRNRVSGGLLIAAGCALALAHPWLAQAGGALAGGA